MSKRKQPEESSTELVAVVNEVPIVGLVDESPEQTIVRGWTIGEGPTVDEEEGSVLAEDWNGKKAGRSRLFGSCSPELVTFVGRYPARSAVRRI